MWKLEINSWKSFIYFPQVFQLYYTHIERQTPPPPLPGGWYFFAKIMKYNYSYLGWAHFLHDFLHYAYIDAGSFYA